MCVALLAKLPFRKPKRHLERLLRHELCERKRVDAKQSFIRKAVATRVQLLRPSVTRLRASRFARHDFVAAEANGVDGRSVATSARRPSRAIDVDFDERIFAKRDDRRRTMQT
jgi:hypothetical protein